MEGCLGFLVLIVLGSSIFGWRVVLFFIPIIIAFVYLTRDARWLDKQKVGEKGAIWLTILAIVLMAGCMAIYDWHEEKVEKELKEEQFKVWMKEQDRERAVRDSLKLVKEEQERIQDSLRQALEGNATVTTDAAQKTSVKGSARGGRSRGGYGSYSTSGPREEYDYEDGYEDGYNDGWHRDHDASRRSDDYEYDDGYSQGYYDAVQEDRDDPWDDNDEEDEEEGW